MAGRFFFFLNQWATTVLQLNKQTAKCKWQKPALGGRRDSRWGFDAAPRLLHFPSIHHRPSAARTGCDRQLLILPHVSAQVSQPAATTGRRKASGQVFRSASAAQAAPRLYRLLAMKFSVGISKSPVIKDKPRLPCKPPVIKGKPRPPCKPPVIKNKPAYPQTGGSACEEGWGLGKRSNRNSFVLLDLHLKYIWKAVETLTRNRLPTQMLGIKKLPGIIILSIYQSVIRIWHILSLKVRNNNFPPWRLERDGILLQRLNPRDYQPDVRIFNTERLTSAQRPPHNKFIRAVTNTQLFAQRLLKKAKLHNSHFYPVF